MRKLKIIEEEVDGTLYKIQELDAENAMNLADITSKAEVAKKMVELSIIEPKIILKETPARVVTKLMDKIAELNGFSKDFPKPQPS